MIEALVLGILQQVVGEYLSSVFNRKNGLMTRAQVVELIELRLKPRVGAQQQLQALNVAERELDVIVSRDPYLDWREGQLDPVTRQGPLREPVDPATALEALAVSVRERRKELRLPESNADPVDVIVEPAEAPDTDESLFVPVEPRADEHSSPWVDRVLALRTVVQEEKRRRER